jgi:hypothetical protein
MGLNTLGWWPFAVILVSGLGLILAAGTGCQTAKARHQLPPMTSQWEDVQSSPDWESEFVVSEEVKDYESERLRQ